MTKIYLSSFLLWVLFCGGCATYLNGESVALRWDDRVRTVYRMTRQPFPREMKLDVDAMLSSPDRLEAKVAELKALELASRSFPMRLTLEGDGKGRIEVLAKNAPVTHASEAFDENERHLREIQKKTVGLVQLNTTIGPHGENLNPFLKSGHVNTVKMLLRLPDDPVAPGASWRLSLVMSVLNTPFLADKTQRDNRVWVNAVIERPGVGKVVEIVYLLREEIEGNRQIEIADRPEPFKYVSTYFAVGEFAVDEHRWLRYVGRLETGIGIFRNVSLVALLPEEKAEP